MEQSLLQNLTVAQLLISRFPWNLRFINLVHESKSQGSIVSQMNPVYNLMPCLYKKEPAF
jgi:hypothetical protein